MSGNNSLPRLEISTEIANENAENFRKWTQAFEIYLLASAMEKTDDKRKIALMLHSMGERGLHIFNSFSLELDKVTFREVKQKFIDYFEPRRNITMARHKFFTLKQGVNESLENFIMELENAGNACEFGALRESLIRDMLIVNMTSSYAQVCQKLLQEPDLSLDRAKLLCRTLTMAQKNQESIKPTEPKESGAVYKLHKNHSPKTSGHHGRRKSRSPSRQFHPRPTAPGSEAACRRCGRSHAPRKCPAWNQKCRSCSKFGHFANVCFRKRNVRNVVSDNINLNDDKEVSSNMAERYFLGSLSNLFNLNAKAKAQGCVINQSNKNNSWHYFLKINNNLVDCIIDTGADINMMSVDVFNKLNIKMSTKDIELCKNYKIFAYGGHKIPIVSVCNLKCVLDNRSDEHINFVITSLNCPTVIGLPTCIKLNLICKNFNIRSESVCSNIVTQYNDVFQGLGCLPYEHSINLKKDAQPCVDPPRKVPFALIEPLKKELDIMEQMGVIEKVNRPTAWVNSLVITKKKNGGLRVCLDPRNLNKHLLRSHFPLKNIDEVRSKLSKARYFSHLDAFSGFYNIKLTNQSSDLCTFQTPFGRYRFLRLPFGINTATEVFCKKMIDLFGDIQGIVIWCDDILIYGETIEEHNKILELFLERARKFNLKLNKSKCKFLLEEIAFVGYIFSKDGVKVDPEKIKAIKDMPTPKNVKDLQRFLGMVNFLSPFIENLSDKTCFLRNLLKKDMSWSWSDNCQRSFELLKDIITKAPVLANYNCNLPLVLSVDASKNAVGAVIMQSGRPIAYSSRTLTSTQQNYAQIEKELFAIQFGCNKFHQYTYGNRVTVHTDHKPLIYVFNKPLHDVPARLQRMMLALQGYDLDVIHVPGKYMYIADTLSRASLDDTYIPLYEQDLKYHVNSIFSNLSVSKSYLDSIVAESNNDESIKLVKSYILNGWPNSKNEVNILAKPYWNMQQDLHIMNDLLFKNNRLVVPKVLQKQLLKKLHAGHLGINKTLSIARDTVYWPNINADIKNIVEQCEVCAKFHPHNYKDTLKPFDMCNLPWERIAVDLLYFDSEYYLVCMDYYSKYIELISLNRNSQAIAVINHLKAIFARHGIPRSLVSDNGPPFNSSLFKEFMHEWDVEHITTSPYYPSSNGQAESGVKIAKSILKKSKESGVDIYMSLLMYRNASKGDFPSPASLLFSRALRCCIPRINSELKPKIVKLNVYSKCHSQSRDRMTFYFNKHARPRSYDIQPGENVYFKKRPDSWWTLGTIKEKLKCGRSFIILDSSGGTYRRNRIHIRPCKLNKSEHVSSPSSTSNGNTDNVAKFVKVNNIIPSMGSAHSGGDDFFSNNINIDSCVRTEERQGDTGYVTRSGRTVKRPQLFVHEKF